MHASSIFFSTGYGDLPALHSFPTRRSSDLIHETYIRVRPSLRPSPMMMSVAPGRATMIGHCQFPPAQEHSYTLRSEEHTSELQSHSDLVCRLLLEKKKTTQWYRLTICDLSH